MNNMIICHNDLDGIMAAEIMKKSHWVEKTWYTTPDGVTTYLDEMMNSGDIFGYDNIFILDLAPSRDCLEKLHEFIVEYNLDIKIVIIDHHLTNLDLNSMNSEKFEIKIQTELNGKPTSATELVYYYCFSDEDKQGSERFHNRLQEVVCAVTQYDTWMFDTVYTESFGYELNLLCFFYRDMFIKAIEDYLNTGEFTKEVKQIIEILKKKRQSAIKYACDNVLQIEDNVIAVFVDEYPNDVAEALKNTYPESLILIVRANGVSVRRGYTCNLNCAEFAELYGGGGHEAAAGFRIPDETKIEYIRSMRK